MEMPNILLWSKLLEVIFYDGKNQISELILLIPPLLNNFIIKYFSKTSKTTYKLTNLFISPFKTKIIRGNFYE
jgi:hypothetical protein